MQELWAHLAIKGLTSMYKHKTLFFTFGVCLMTQEI